MKKVLALLLAMTMAFSLTACGAKEEGNPAPAEGGEGTEAPEIGRAHV